MSHEFVDQLMESNKAGDLRSPVSGTLGMDLVEFGRGEAVYEMAAREELGNPLGVIQGGVATALADAAMAATTMRFRRWRSRRSTSSRASSDPLTRRRSNGCARRPGSSGPADGWCGPRPTCW